jgi:hypothetical protein
MLEFGKFNEIVWSGNQTSSAIAEQARSTCPIPMQLRRRLAPWPSG